MRIAPQRVAPNLPPSLMGGMEAAAERRAHPRRRARQPGWIDAGDVCCAVHMRDISAGGIGFDFPRPLTVGRTYRMRLGTGGGRMTRDVKIVRCDPAAGGFTVGAKY